VIKYELEGQCRSYKDVPKDARIVSVNSKLVLGYCEICNKPIFEGQDYYADVEGIVVHHKCYDIGD